MTPEQYINCSSALLREALESSKALKCDYSVKAAKLVIQAKLDRLNEREVIYNVLLNEYS
jgi:hypothetical protein